jgi:hypothetical protein
MRGSGRGRGSVASAIAMSVGAGESPSAEPNEHQPAWTDAPVEATYAWSPEEEEALTRGLMIYGRLARSLSTCSSVSRSGEEANILLYHCPVVRSSSLQLHRADH